MIHFTGFLAGEANNLEVSLSRLGGLVDLLDTADATAAALVDLVREHPRDSFDKTFEVEWHLFHATRTELLIACACALRGHLTTSEQIARRIIELTATAWRLHRAPELLPLWLVEKGDPRWKQRKEVFRVWKLFPDDDPTIYPLYERYELLNEMVHGSITSLARRQTTMVEGDTLLFHANVFELHDDDPSQPARTLLYLIQTYGKTLDVFATAWAPYLGPRAATWGAKRAALDDELQRHIDA